MGEGTDWELRNNSSPFIPDSQYQFHWIDADYSISKNGKEISFKGDARSVLNPQLLVKLKDDKLTLYRLSAWNQEDTIKVIYGRP